MKTKKTADTKAIKMMVQENLLFQPKGAWLLRQTIPDPSTCYMIGDRIVCVIDNHRVPRGLRGTVTAIENAANRQDIDYEIVFDQHFEGALMMRGVPEVIEGPNAERLREKQRLRHARVYIMKSWYMINLSHGQRLESEQKNTPERAATLLSTST